MIRIAIAVAALGVLSVQGVEGTAPAAGSPVTPVCWAEPDPPEYYAFPLVPTRRVPGTGAAEGRADVHFGSSPFGVRLAEDGSYHYELRIRIGDLPQPRSGNFVVWLTTPQLDRVERLGPLPANGILDGSVRWNKFLVVVTLEPDGARAEDGWTGPIVMRGMSRSGAMHTMAGHGPFEQENCAAYGYGDF